MFSSSVYINIIITIVVSFMIILLCQHLWNYLLDTCSTKKTKDLVNGQMEKYKKIMGILKENESSSSSSTTSVFDGDSNESYISKIEKKEMNEDLENYLKDIL